MPFEPVSDLGNFIGTEGGEGKFEPEVPESSYSEVLGARFRTENLAGSIMASEATRFAFEPRDPSLDIVGIIANGPYESFMDRFEGARSLDHIQAIKNDIDRETADRAMKSSSGAVDIAFTLAAGLFDLPTLLPAGVAVRSAKFGYNVLATAGKTAVAGTLAAGSAEAGLQATQQIRSPLESAINIGASTILSGVIGAGIGALVPARAIGLAGINKAKGLGFGGSNQAFGLFRRIENDFKVPPNGVADIYEARSYRAPFDFGPAEAAVNKLDPEGVPKAVEPTERSIFVQIGDAQKELKIPHGTTAEEMGFKGDFAVVIDDIIKILPDNIKVGLQDRLHTPVNKAGMSYKASGLWTAKTSLLQVALDSKNARGVLRHETLHALRQTGVLTEDEWLVLARASVEGDWIKRFRIVERYEKSLRERGLSEQVIAEKILEESIADGFMNWHFGRLKAAEAATVKPTFKFLSDTIGAVKNAIRGKKLPSADELFEQIESGKIKGRGIEEEFNAIKTSKEAASKSLESTPEIRPTASAADTASPQTLRVFHATTAKFKEFDKQFSGFEGAFFFSRTRKSAGQFIKGIKGGRLLEADVKIDNPLVYDFVEKTGEPFVVTEKNGLDMFKVLFDIIDEAKAKGNDSVIVRNMIGRGFAKEAKSNSILSEQIIVLDPNKIDLNPTASAAKQTPNLGGTARSAGAAAVEQLNNTLKSAYGVEKAFRGQDPMIRLMSSSSLKAREFSQELTETPMFFAKNAEGLETAPGGTALGEPGAVETRMARWQYPLSLIVDKTNQEFLNYRGASYKKFGAVAARAIGDLVQTPELMTYSQFSKAVVHAMRNGDIHEVPEVQIAAKFAREKFFDPLLKRAIDLDMIPEGVNLKTAASYVMRVYNKEKIAKHRNEFKDAILPHLRSTEEINNRVRDSLRPLLQERDSLAKEISNLKKRVSSSQVTSELKAKKQRLDEVLQDVEDQVIAYRGKTSKQAKSGVKKVQEASEGRSPEKARLRSADEDVLKAARKIASDLEKEPLELDDIANNIIGRILGTPEGRLPYDHYAPTENVSGVRMSKRGPFNARVFDIPDNLIEDWLENDFNLLARLYSRSVVPDLEIKARFGSTDMLEQFQEIQREYAIKADDPSLTPKARKSLNDQKNNDIRDLAAIRDRLRGTYLSSNHPDGMVARSGAVIRSLNYLRLLGGMTPSAAPDIARFIMRHGVIRTVRDGMVPMFTNFSRAKLAFEEVKMAGTALDMVLDTRAMSLADIGDDFGRHTVFERGVTAATQNFGLVSLMAPWNAAMKQFAGMITMTRILQAAENQRLGKATRVEIELLREGSISPENANRIAELFGVHGSKDGGVWHANTAEWLSGADREAGRTTSAAIDAFRGAVKRDVDRTIITPGQEKPLFMSSDVGKTIGQFKTFGISSTQRTIIAGLQQGDAGVYNGAMLAIALGGLVHIFKQKQNGKEVDVNDPQFLIDAIDRSGLTAWIMDANAMTEKMTRGAIGLSALTGKPISRYASRNVVASMLGPSFGTATDIAKVTGSIGALFTEGTSGITQSDTRAMRRLIPYQNLFYLRTIFDQVEEGVNKQFGIPVRK